MKFTATIIQTVSDATSLKASKGITLEALSHVVLKAEPDNKKDSNAISVWVDDLKVGYLANSDTTTLPGTRKASSLANMINSQKVAATTALIVGEEESLTPAVNPNLSSLPNMYRFRANLFFVPKDMSIVGSEANDSEEDNNFVFTTHYTAVRCTTNVDIATRIKTHSDILSSGKKPGKSAKMPELEIGIQPESVDVDDLLSGGTSAWIHIREKGKNPNSFCHAEVFDASNYGGNVPVALQNMLTEIATRGWLPITPTGITTIDDSDVSKTNFEVSFSANKGSSNTTNDEVDLNKHVYDAIYRGAGQSDEIKSKVAYLLGSGASAPVVVAALNHMGPSIKKNIPTLPDCLFKSSDKTIINDVVTSIIYGQPIRLVGDKGTGKNTLIETVCWLLNLPLVRVQGSVELDKMDLLGSVELIDGSTNFVLSPAMEGLRDGAIVVVDEANLVRPDVLGMLHSVTDTARSINIPGYGTVALHSSSNVMYTLNEGYVGTGDMNEATVDRCVSFVLQAEVSLKDILETDDKTIIDACQALSDTVLKSVLDGTLPNEAITVRGYKAAAKMASGGLIPIGRALERTVAHKVQDEGIRKSLSNMIRMLNL